ncbi:MAG: FG-GAP-like repeat-containing protein, partial [Candidatus Omnitrophota bacterium]|nr:FG-GAP-like repeat-containing protein [Candidatus Omnitrophota bacterium]
WILVTNDYCTTSGNSYCTPNFSDIDNDGDYDLFFGSGDGRIFFYKNNGTANVPSFSLEATYNNIKASSNSNSRIAFCDIDGDGDYDMFIGANSVINFYRNDGTKQEPSWTFVTNEYNSITDAMNARPSFADIDGDNDYDMFIGGLNGLDYFQNSGTPYAASWLPKVAYYGSLDVGYDIAPVFCDIDNDGDSDLFIGTLNGNLLFYRNDGTELQAQWTLVSNDYDNFNIGSVIRPTFGDIDGDGDYDICIGNERIYYQNSSGVTDIYENTGTPENPSWEFMMTVRYPGGKGTFSTPTLCDIDNDGDADLFIGDKNGNIAFWRNTTITNTAPDVTIASILPNPAFQGDSITFAGTAQDEGDEIAAYKWTSSIDGLLSESASFSINTLSLGTHTITFEARDSYGLWSQPATATLEIKPDTPPTVSISSILPNPAYAGDIVSFIGTAGDPDTGDTITAYKWTSSKDGILSDKASFTKNTLSTETHTITFEAQNNHGAWSNKATSTLEVKPKTGIYELSLKNGQTVSGNVYVTMNYDGKPLSWFNFMVDGQYVNSNPWMTQYFTNGTHVVYGQSGLNKTTPITVNINNAVSYLPEIISPANGAKVSGNVNISFKTEKGQAYYAFIYVNGKIIGGKDLYRLASPYYYMWDTTKLPAGEYEIKVLIYYFSVGAVASNPIKVTVNNSIIPTPTLNLTCPNPASKTVNVHISSSSNADFFAGTLYVDGKLVGIQWWLPGDIYWDTTKFANGNHNLHFQVYNRLLKKWLAVDRVIQVKN